MPEKMSRKFEPPELTDREQAAENLGLSFTPRTVECPDCGDNARLRLDKIKCSHCGLIKDVEFD